MRPRSRSQKSTLTSNELLESAASVGVHKLVVRRESKRRRGCREWMFPWDRRVLRHCNRVGAALVRAGLRAHVNRRVGQRQSIRLDKQDMPPCGCAKLSGVIVRITRPSETVVRHLVPFFARDLACFATDTHGRISEEPDLHIFLHVIVPPLVRALCSFADHWKN